MSCHLLTKKKKKIKTVQFPSLSSKTGQRNDWIPDSKKKKIIVFSIVKVLGEWENDSRACHAKGGQDRKETAVINNQIIGAGMHNVYTGMHMWYTVHIQIPMIFFSPYLNHLTIKQYSSHPSMEKVHKANVSDQLWDHWP